MNGGGHASPEAPRLFRALAQYQAALRYWNTGLRVLVLAHLYITCEVLTKAVQRFHATAGSDLDAAAGGRTIVRRGRRLRVAPVRRNGRATLV